jgi:hypothetical protein
MGRPEHAADVNEEIVGHARSNSWIRSSTGSITEPSRLRPLVSNTASEARINTRRKCEAGNQVNNSSAPLANFREGAHQIRRQSSKINASSYALMTIQRTANLTV